MRTNILLFLLGVGWSPSLFSQASDGESAQLTKIHEIVSAREFRLNQPEKKSCADFIDDLRLQRGMAVIEPIARAKDYDDSALRPYRDRCSPHPINEIYACDARATAGVRWSRDWSRRRYQYKEYCEVYEGTRNFKVYEIDVNNNPQDGNELVVYFEGARGPVNRPAQRTIFTDGGYRAYDAKDCSLKANARTHDPYNHFLGRAQPNYYNALVSYNNKPHVLDLHVLGNSKVEPDRPTYWLQVSTLDDTRDTWCSYTSRGDRSSGKSNAPRKQP